MHRLAIGLGFALALPLALGCVDVGEGGRAHRPVIGGDPTPASSFVATGGLVGDGQIYCTGTLISPTAVLTAGHCLAFAPGIPGFTLILDGSAGVNPADVYPGQSVHVHPTFAENQQVDANGMGKFDDVGVVILATPVTGVMPEALPTVDEAVQILAVDAPVDIVGYGLTSNESSDFGVKHHGTASLVIVGEHELRIAKPGEQQNCNGDSGGPAFIDVAGGGRRMVGIVSRSPDDNTVCDHGGIDTRVDPYVPWIQSLVSDLCGGDAGPCPVAGDAGPGMVDAAPPLADASPVAPDAVVTPTGDAGGDDVQDEAGCGCTGGTGSSPSAPLILLAVALVARRRAFHLRP